MHIFHFTTWCQLLSNTEYTLLQAVYEQTHCSSSSPTLALIFEFLPVWKCLIIYLICISLIKKEIEELLLFLTYLFNFLFWECQFGFFSLFLGCLSFIDLYILEMSLLSVLYVISILSCSVACLSSYIMSFDFAWARVRPVKSGFLKGEAQMWVLVF